MDPRERERIILVGGIAAVIVLVIAIFAGIVIGKASDLESSKRSKRRALVNIRKAAKEYSRTLDRTRNLEARLGGDRQLLSYMENLSRRAGITDATMKVSENSGDYFDESIVEIRSKSKSPLNLRQVTNLLKLIENSPRYLRIKQFQLKTPYAKPELLNLTLRVAAYSKKQEKKPEEKTD